MTIPLPLTFNTLKSLLSVVEVPTYSRSGLKGGIVHIGVGGFHRAHQAFYLDDLHRGGGGETWSIIGAGLLPSDGKMQEALAAQDYLYTVLQKNEAGTKARVVGSITDFIWVQESVEALLKALVRAETKIVSLTITEGSYPLDQSIGALNTTHPDIAHDLKNPSAPRSAFGFIVEALGRRRESGIAPFTVLSCDNIQGNGNVTRKIVHSFAELRDRTLAEWVADNVSFPNCMVDRITPMTTAADREYVEREYGYTDRWPVTCEPFIQWVIEDDFCNGRPAFEDVGVQFTKDVQPYEKMKLRLLNASHAAMGYLGYLAGFRYINDVVLDPEFQSYVRRMMDEEVTPLLDPVPGIDLTAYKAKLIERFSNPAIRDQVLRICQDGSGKIPKFIVPSIKEAVEKGRPFERLALCVAAWFRYLNGVDEEGGLIELNDPRGAALFGIAKQGEGAVREFLAQQELFGSLVESVGFVTTVEKAVKSLYANGARKTLQKYA
jgi:mannitol 2-dehydrogenase